jgi:hypothetical protein
VAPARRWRPWKWMKAAAGGAPGAPPVTRYLRMTWFDQ